MLGHEQRHRGRVQDMGCDRDRGRNRPQQDSGWEKGRGLGRVHGTSEDCNRQQNTNLGASQANVSAVVQPKVPHMNSKTNFYPEQKNAKIQQGTERAPRNAEQRWSLPSSISRKISQSLTQAVSRKNVLAINRRRLPPSRFTLAHATVLHLHLQTQQSRDTNCPKRRHAVHTVGQGAVSKAYPGHREGPCTDVPATPQSMFGCDEQACFTRFMEQHKQTTHCNNRGETHTHVERDKQALQRR